MSFRSEVPNVKIRDEFVLVLTTRQLRCCADVSVIPPKIVDVVVVPVQYIAETVAPAAPALTPIYVMIEGTLAPAPPATPTVTPPIPITPATSTSNAPSPQAGWAQTGTSGATLAMTLAQVNELQQCLAAETRRLSAQVSDVSAAPSRDGEFVLHSLLTSVLDDPRRFKALRSDAGTLGLADKELEQLAKALGRSGERLNRFDLIFAPEQLLHVATGRSGADLVRLRLEAAGLPTVACDETPGPQDSGTQQSAGRKPAAGTKSPSPSKRRK